MASISGTVALPNNNLDWKAYAYETNSKLIAGTGPISTMDGSYSIENLTPGTPYYVTVCPKVSNIWNSNDIILFDNYICPFTPTTIPYIYIKVLVAILAIPSY